MSTVKTKNLFQAQWSVWKFAGLVRPRKNQFLYYLWIIVLNGCLIFFYPLHLVLGLFEATNKMAIFQNLSTTFVNMQGSIKHILIWWNLGNIRHIEEMYAVLDRSIETKAEQIYYKKIVTRCKYILNVTGVLYAITAISSEGSSFLGDERHLMYQGWMPIDWRTSLTNYIIANMYQFIGVSIQIAINFANDTYPAVSLVALSGHMHLLAMRVSQLAVDSRKSHQANNRELKACIKDHKRLINVHWRLSQVLSFAMFLQILGTSFNLCFSIIYLLFFADNAFAIAYYVFLLMALPLQIFPSCYFGSVYEAELEGLQNALFSCNWLDQDREFKQNILIFSQRNLRRSPFVCMGFFRIHLDSFFYALKSAYSLSAVILQTK